MSFSLRALLQIGRSLGPRCVLLTAIHPIRRRLLEGRFRQRGSVDRSAEPLGDVLAVRADGQSVDLTCRNGTLRLEVLADDLLRFRLRPPHTTGFPPLFSYALDPLTQWTPVPTEVEESAETIAIRTARLGCRVQRSPCRLSLSDAEGNSLSEDGEGFTFRGQGASCARRLADGEAIYGLGEKAFPLDLRGRSLEMWNKDPACYSPGTDPIYVNIPFFVSFCAGRAHGFFFDNPGRSRFDLGHSHPDLLRYEADTGELCGYFCAGPTIPDVLSQYTRLTGRMPMPPRWLLGYQQSRWSYYPEAEVKQIAAEFRSRRIPCDVIYLDIHCMDGYRVFTWDPKRFPDPPRLLRELREQGFYMIASMDTGVKAERGYPIHDDGVARGAFCRLPDGTLFRAPVWPGDCHFPDFTDPEVRAWWGEQHRSLLDSGVSGIWADMNEPAVFGGEMAPAVVHRYEGRGASHGEVHNAYGLEMAHACADGARRLRPGERVPLISRAGYAGIQRHALIWTGDNLSTWEHLRLGVSMCLNLGLSGVALCGPDIGGFAGDCDGELLSRWTQVGTLTPFFRNHSALGTARQEPWAFGEPYESICRRWIELRYELLPYLYTAAWLAAQTGLPMMRPLALAFPTDRRTYGLDDQFLLGDALLAAPVFEAGQTTRQVYLPGGTWYDLWSGQALAGEISASAPLERMPVFVKAGSVLPMAAVVQHTNDRPPEAMHLRVYPGDGESWLYEDDGHSLAYTSGDYRRSRFVCGLEGDRLTVERQAEGPFNPGYDRFEIYACGLPLEPRQVLADGQAVGAPFDPETRTARLRLGPWRRIEVLLAPGS